MTWFPPTRIEAIMAGQELHREDEHPGTLYVCHGPPRCDVDQSSSPVSCRWCAALHPGDTRTAGEIELGMRRQQRGH